MPQKISLVALSDAERKHLEQLLRGGMTATRQLTRARILLKAAEGWTDERIAEALSVGALATCSSFSNRRPAGATRRSPTGGRC